MSPDGKYLLYTAASQANDVHVTPNQLFVFDLEKNEESRIMSDEKAFVAMRGWIKSE
jgi:Tol biopolymer transport system component